MCKKSHVNFKPISGDLMNLQDLIYFRHLSESLNFTATAEYFFVSQPSISMAVKRLETAFNATLLDRRRVLKNMQLTPAGEILYQNATEIIEKLEKTKQSIEDIELEQVYFGFLPTIGAYFLPHILPKMTKYTKSLKLIEEESSDIMLDLLLKEEIPIAILGHERSLIPHNKIKQILLLEEEIALWVAKNHPLATKESVTASEITDEVFISLAEGYTHHRIFEKWISEQGIKEPEIVYAKEIKTVQSIAASTEMVGFMSDILLGEQEDLVKVSLKNAPKFYISLALNTETEHTYFQREFNKEMLEIVKNHTFLQ